MDKVGVIHGKFQVMHLGHMEYLLAAKMRCDHLIVGISDPDPGHIRFNPSKSEISSRKAHPLTYFERMEMVKGALLEFGVSQEDFDIVPFPIDDPTILPSYVPMDAVFYMTIYSEWDTEKKKLLESMNCRVQVLWDRYSEEKKISGTKVLKAISEEEQWKEMVPKSVYNYITNHGLEDRIRSLMKADDTDNRV